VQFYKSYNPEELVLIGTVWEDLCDSGWGKNGEVTKVVSLCAPPDRVGAAEDWEGNGFRHSRDLPE